MADLNALIAQGAQFRVPPPVDPMGNMPQLMQMQSMQQQNQLNQMTMQEKQRGQQEMNALRGVMSRPGFDLSTPASQRDVYNVAPTLAENLIKGHLGNVKIMGEASNLKLTGQKLAIEAAAERAKLIGQAGRDINSRPDDENLISYDRDIQNSPLFTPEEKQAAANRTKQLLAMPMADRATYLSQQGISAGELSTAATAKAGQGVTMRGQDIVADTAAAGPCEKTVGREPAATDLERFAARVWRMRHTMPAMRPRTTAAATTR
jgi:prophage maintenance system killer protein